MTAVTMTSSAASRVGQFIRLLGSDKSGEIVAASRAIRRTLATAGLDLHDFAGLAERALAPRPEAEIDDGYNTGLIIKFCFRRRDELGDREAQFITDIDRLARRLGAKLQLSAKQTVWLHKLFEHLRGVR
jgi:hypothetical protein